MSDYKLEDCVQIIIENELVYRIKKVFGSTQISELFLNFFGF